MNKYKNNNITNPFNEYTTFPILINNFENVLDFNNRNNLNNRLVAFKAPSQKNLPPSHMLHGLDEAQCKALLERVIKELKTRF